MAELHETPPPSIALTQRCEPDGGSTVRLVGELDATTRPSLERKLFDLAESEDTVVDLSATTFIDLGSVRMLVACRERARESGHDMEIIKAPPHVDRMLAMLERGGYWRPRHFVRPDEGETYEPPVRTTTDAERSNADSEQIVRLQCTSCGTQTFRPESSLSRVCENCGSMLEAVAVFRDRRRITRSVDVDRRRD